MKIIFEEKIWIWWKLVDYF